MGKAILEDLVSSYGTPERALKAVPFNDFDFLILTTLFNLKGLSHEIDFENIAKN
jgi:hypothetical protein